MLSVAQTFQKDLFSLTSLNCTLSIGGTPAYEAISLTLNPNGPAIGDQGYLMQIQPSGISISSLTPQGNFYGTRTILQLLRLEEFDFLRQYTRLPYIRSGVV